MYQLTFLHGDIVEKLTLELESRVGGDDGRETPSAVGYSSAAISEEKLARGFTVVRGADQVGLLAN
jgi:hypothetical protein